MSEERKLWRVTLRREVDVYVVAESATEAEQIALDEADDEIRDADTVAEFVAPCTSAPKGDEGALVYGEDEDRTVAEVLTGAPRLSERIAAWEAEQPETLDALLAWAARMPSDDGRFPYHATIDGGAAVGDGWALIAIDGATSTGSEWSKKIATAITKVSAQTFGRATVSPEALAAWLSEPDVDGEVPRIGTALGVPISRALVARTAGHAARITGAEVTVAVGYAGTIWSGPGWRAVVMPLRENGPRGSVSTGPVLAARGLEVAS